ncbi:MAG: hypothetical protein ABW252_11995 [Polyangiales bacterium]
MHEVNAAVCAGLLAVLLGGAGDIAYASPDAATAPPDSGEVATKQRCPKGQPLRIEGKVSSGEIEELSGLVVSRRQPGVLWVHNDSGDKGRLYALDVHGRLLMKVKLDDVDPKDVEDIAIGKGPDGADAIILADTGDNDRKREHVRLYRLREPKVSLGDKQPKQKHTVHTIDVRYEDGPHDVETLLVDPRDGDLYLVEKAPLLSSQQEVGVYRVSAAEVEAGRATARRVARLPLGPATAGDVLPDGSAIAVRSYTRLFLWPRKPGESLVDALARPGCALPLADLGQQGEAFGFIPDGSGYFTSVEGEHAPIHRYALGKK